MESLNKLKEALELTRDSSIRVRISQLIEDVEKSDDSQSSFDEWMFHRVKSVHYANLERMDNANYNLINK